ncbi:hypothetical protein GCM10027176_41600 [Actinoallomurus bryophytorum]
MESPISASPAWTPPELRVGRTIAYVHGSAMPGAVLPKILARPVADLSPNRLEIVLPGSSDC